MHPPRLPSHRPPPPRGAPAAMPGGNALNDRSRRTAPDGGSAAGEQRGVDVRQVADGQHLGGAFGRRRCLRRWLERLLPKLVVRHLRPTPSAFTLPFYVLLLHHCLRHAQALQRSWSASRKTWSHVMCETSVGAPGSPRRAACPPRHARPNLTAYVIFRWEEVQMYSE